MNRKWLSDVKRIVVKVGSSVLTSDTGYLSKPAVNKLVRWLYELKTVYNKEVILVSSGAIACGMDMLNLEKRPTELSMQQAAAAIGQGRLINTYKTAFKRKGVHVAQILLTIDGLHNRSRYLNARNTVNALIELGAVPIVNENDTVATEEIRFGDNDNLAAQVAMMADADLLVILSDVDGFYADGKVMHSIEKIDKGLKSHLKKKTRGTTVGGMESKLDMGFKLMRLGMPMIIANGATPNVLKKIVDGGQIGTLFYPVKKKEVSKKRWLAFAASTRNSGTIVLDDGAVDALVKKGRSLLPAGILKVEGRFKFGDAVRIMTTDGREIAKGIVNYSSDEINDIKGARSSKIASILGQNSYDEVIHRDNLIVLH